jgi:hypothetical protein
VLLRVGMPPASAAKLSALVTDRQLSTLGGAAVLGVFASEAAAVAFQSGGGGWVPSTNDVWVPSDSGADVWVPVPAENWGDWAPVASQLVTQVDPITAGASAITVNVRCARPLRHVFAHW